jgi:hypothetical protein
VLKGSSESLLIFILNNYRYNNYLNSYKRKKKLKILPLSNRLSGEEKEESSTHHKPR